MDVTVGGMVSVIGSLLLGLLCYAGGIYCFIAIMVPFHIPGLCASLTLLFPALRYWKWGRVAYFQMSGLGFLGVLGIVLAVVSDYVPWCPLFSF